jgi:cell wall-associated NlpC family hydrolase
MPISGVAVGLVATGSIFVWSGIKNQSPIDTVKTVLGRKTSGVKLSADFGSIASGIRSAATSAAVGSAVSAVAAAAGSTGGDLVTEAAKHLGAKYVFNTAGPTTFDCSGLVVYCCRHTRWPSCPRFTTYTFGSWAKSAGWTRITLSQVVSGDVIVKSGHMAIATSNTTMIAAPHTGDVVKRQTIYSRSAWWGWRPPAAAAATATKKTAAR